jgi:hypothetical protein
LELTQKYLEIFSVKDIDQIQEIYLKFYATVYGAHSAGVRSLAQYMPDELKKQYKKK